MARYSIWVLEYARMEQFPEGAVLYGSHNEGARRLPFAYILIQGDGVVAMVDTGYNNVEYAEQFATELGVSNWRPPRDVLAECGVKPEDVSHVFITHGHFDHMGGLDFFPNATFFIQERELSGWVKTMALGRRFRWLMGGVDPADVMRLVDLGRRGRLVAIDGVRRDVLPGIDVHPAYDTHTSGSQYLVVRNSDAGAGDRWVLAGDLIYSYDNLVGPDDKDPSYVPIGNATGSQTNLLQVSDEMLHQVDGDIRRIVPVHEDRLKDKFPSRIGGHGLWITEIARRDGEVGRASG